MPPKSLPLSDGLVDTWGRNNRVLADHSCAQCGARFRPARRSARYCSRRCAWDNNGGQNANTGRGWLNAKGYREVRRAGRNSKEHRIIAEQMTGRPLLRSEDVHHRNGDKADNRPENLEVIAHGEHSRLTNAGRSYRRGYKLSLSDSERARRSARMKERHRLAKLAAPRATPGA